MIKIYNVTKVYARNCHYHLCIGNKIITQFNHYRPDGLAVCLRHAADAVEQDDLDRQAADAIVQDKLAKQNKLTELIALDKQNKLTELIALTELDKQAVLTDEAVLAALAELTELTELDKQAVLDKLAELDKLTDEAELTAIKGTNL